MKFSEAIDKLMPALVKFRAVVGTPKKNAVNPYHESRYADLQSVIDVVQPAMAETGLTYLYGVIERENEVGVYTVFAHESGQMVEFDPIFVRVPKNDAQGKGNALTYARRYSLATAAGVASEPDDDGNAISGLNTKRQQQSFGKSQGKKFNGKQQQQTQKPDKKTIVAQPEPTTNQRGLFFKLAADRGLSEKVQKMIVEFYTHKTSRADVTETEWKEINLELPKLDKDALMEMADTVKQRREQNHPPSTDVPELDMYGNPIEIDEPAVMLEIQ